ncbi:MAG: hypothetical protein JJ864_01995 [Rhizobiaceae bacterium]|nr:hypothetical protein [Rhizobiaceae bacterium]
MTVGDDQRHWSRFAREWIDWARSPDHDAFWAYRSAFAEFVGAGSGELLDIGCGEGRVARTLGSGAAALLRAVGQFRSSEKAS